MTITINISTEYYIADMTNISDIITKNILNEIDEISKNVVIGSSKSISVEDGKIVVTF